METPVTLATEKATLDIEDSSDAPTTVTKESNLVDWDEPADPRNPLNWFAGMRYGQVVIVSLLSLVV